MKHVRITNANAEPVFFTYNKQEAIDEIVEGVTGAERFTILWRMTALGINSG